MKVAGEEEENKNLFPLCLFYFSLFQFQSKQTNKIKYTFHVGWRWSRM